MTDKEKIINLYGAVNKMMTYLGAVGEIDTKNTLTDDVMEALYRIDDGEISPGAMEKLLNKIENDQDERQNVLF